MQKPILIDLDGVLRLENKPAKDIIPFLQFLENNRIQACVLSNSSLYSSAQIYKYFESHSVEINIPIITAIDSAYEYVQSKYSRVAAYTSESVIGMFGNILNYENPEAVLIGDIGDVWNYKLIQTIFEYVENGAELIAVHKNKFWKKPGAGIQLDAGPFIHAIEYSTSTAATIIGKPSRIYFQQALKKIDANIDESFFMLGDDLETDMKGAKDLGAQTILLFTGKTKNPIKEIDELFVDYQANNLLEVIAIIKKLKRELWEL